MSAIEVVVAVGRLGADANVRGARHHHTERFVSFAVDPGMVLRESHHGGAVAVLDRSWTDDGGTLWAAFTALPGCEAACSRMEGRKASIEFTSTTELRHDATLDGGSVLLHRGALLLGVAADDYPARSDCRVELVRGHAPEPTVQVRSAAYPQAIRDRLDGRLCYAAPTGKVLGLR